MADKSGIEWTDATWNPTTGCSRVSAGCDNCYAIAQSARVEAMQDAQGRFPNAYTGTTRVKPSGRRDFTGRVNLQFDRLDQPIWWRRPRKIFVNSMSDLFHPGVPKHFVARVFATMALTPHHTYQILTKRPSRMRTMLYEDERVPPSRRFSAIIASCVRPALAYLSEIERAQRPSFEALTQEHPCGTRTLKEYPLRNVLLGTSVENEKVAVERVHALLETPAHRRFLSMEPLLGDVSWYTVSGEWTDRINISAPQDAYEAHPWTNCEVLRGIDWIILGGESGPGARKTHLEHMIHQVRAVEHVNVLRARAQPYVEPLAVFVKQLGSRPFLRGVPYPMQHSRKGGDIRDFPDVLRVRDFPSL